MRLFSYKLAHDTGFAPNPFMPCLTLANCKSGMRKTKIVGDWIAGFTSKTLCGDPVGEERLIFLMNVSEKLMYKDYYLDERFSSKIPNRSEPGPEPKAGDNIYVPSSDYSGFSQLENYNHDARSIHDDLSGKFVLVAEEFYYFGRNAIPLSQKIRPHVPKGQSKYGYKTAPGKAIMLVEFLRENYHIGIHGAPHIDMNWQNYEINPK